MESVTTRLPERPRPSTPAKPDIPLRSTAPDSKDQPVVVKSNQDTTPPLEQKASGSHQWAHTLPPHGGDNVKTGSNFSATRGIDKESQSPIDNGNERLSVWQVALFIRALREKIGQQDDEIPGPLAVPTVSSAKRLARMEEAEGDDKDGDLVEISHKLEEYLSSEPLPEKERAVIASVKNRLEERLLAKYIPGKTSTLASAQAEESPLDLSGLTGPYLDHRHHIPRESSSEVLVPTFSNSDHVPRFDTKDEHFGEFTNLWSIV